MTIDALITLGLPGGSWPTLAQNLLQGTAFARSLGGQDADAADTADESLAARIATALAAAPQGGLCTAPELAAAIVARPPANSAMLALVEHPVAALAAALDADPELDAMTWLAAWQHAGQRLLRLAQRHRARCLLVDADEAARQPQLLCERLARLVPMAHNGAVSAAGPAQQIPGPIVVDPLALALADVLCAKTPGLIRLHREMLAACEPLSAGAMALTASPLADPRAALQALAALRLAAHKAQAALQAALARQEALLKQSEALRSELGEARASNAQAQGDRQAADKRSQQLGRELSRLEGQAAKAIATTAEAESRAAQATAAALQGEATAARWRERLAEAEAALGQAEQDHGQQLAQLQAQLQAQARAQRDAQSQAQADLQAQQQVHQAQLAQQADEQAEQRRLLSEQAQAHRKALAKLQQAQAEALRQTGEQAARNGSARDLAQAEADLLLRQLHDTQEALEQTELALRKLRAAQAALPPAVPGELVIGEVRSADANDDPPYRGLSFMLRRVRAGNRPLADTQVRLVEHHGHPGLAVFQHSGGDAPLLQAWRESGREGDRAYLLLVPTDAHCLPALQAMDGSDWQHLLAVVARMVVELRRGPAAQRKTWLSLACRLSEQLQELPAQLRHGGVQGTVADGGQDLLLQIRQLSWGVRRLDELSLRWQPDGSLRGLGLQCADDGSVPLLSWPEDEQGDSPQVFWLPLGSHRSEEVLAHWARLPQPDRLFVQVLLDALPRLVADLPATAVSQGLVAAAQVLQTEARQTLFAPPAPPAGLMRRVARRLLRRGNTR